MLLYAVDPTGLSPWLADALPIPAWLSVVLYLALYASVAALVRAWLLTYAWHAFPRAPLYTGTTRAVDLASNTILAVCASPCWWSPRGGCASSRSQQR